MPVSKAKRQQYYKARRKSKCAKKGLYACKVKSPRCKTTKKTSKKRAYCRKSKNNKYRKVKK